jgi:hypothetical protein
MAGKPAADVLESEMSILRAVGFQGLPTTYIGGRRIIGAQSDDTFSDALERASRAQDERGVPAWAYVLGLLALAAAVVRFGLKSRLAAGRPGEGDVRTHTPT